MHIVMCLVWILIGCALSIPYTILSGGSLDNFYVTMMVSPALAFYFFVYSKTCALVARRPLWKTGMFWFLLTWACMPIIFNLGSIVLGHCGFSLASDWVFRMRYATLGLPFLIGLVALVLVWIAHGAINIIKLLGNGQPNS